jgi:L-amino acid N-acyltransferase YncA
VLPAELQGRGAYELTNIFTIPRLRGRGAAGLLVMYAMAELAQEDRVVACARILPQRTSSIAMIQKAGFEKLGLLTSGTKLGRTYYYLEPASKDC